ncbi:hypothetical protein DPPLL_36560 [Desulfofustis limnaeus]|jgi:hypothetical protein|uniref:Uncharacterized protein n=1 Tax=Desulfofustis limnaeus TaxID=2740163 RepID=A0ABN6M8X7_9BACT|nr:hypothetical protein DPPLL_36560 [Desulfofustis limnaeus]
MDQGSRQEPQVFTGTHHYHKLPNVCQSIMRAVASFGRTRQASLEQQETAMPVV